MLEREIEAIARERASWARRVEKAREKIPYFDEIKEHLNNIASAIDPISEDSTRRYIDCQLAMIHRKLIGTPCEDMEEHCELYRLKMESSYL